MVPQLPTVETYSKHILYWVPFLPCLISFWCFLGSPHKYIVCIQILILGSPSQTPNLRQVLLTKNHCSHRILIAWHCDKHFECIISLIFTTSLGGKFCSNLQMKKLRLRRGSDMLKVPRLVTGRDKVWTHFCLLSNLMVFKYLSTKRIWIIPWDHGCEDSLQKLEFQLSSLCFYNGLTLSKDFFPRGLGQVNKGKGVRG